MVSLAIIPPALLFLVYMPHQVHAHGYIQKPTHRGTMWRFPSLYPAMATPPNYNDNALNGGGPALVRANYPVREYGVCGDPHTASQPRPHETGGTFGRFRQLGSAAIAACYAPGATIDIEIKITAHHRGYFQFQLCTPGDNDETEQCFQNGHLLQKADGQGTDYQLPDLGERVYSMAYKLPDGVLCYGSQRCVLRWYWLSGNSPSSIYKEEFWNCADIQISPDCGGDPSPLPPPSSPSPSPSPSPAPSKTAATLPTSTPSISPASSTAATATPTPTELPSDPKPRDCTCNEGHCPSGFCDNCLLTWENGSRRSCYFGWAYWQCHSAGSSYTWCGA